MANESRTVEVRLVNPAFIQRMDLELAAHAHEGDWSAWNPSVYELLNRITYHLDNLGEVVDRNKQAEVTKCAVALANYSMKLFELYGDDKL